MENIIKLSKMEVQSSHDRVRQAENLILQLPDTHEGRNSWLMNFGVKKESQNIRENNYQRLEDLGYKPRELIWNKETDCLCGVE